MNPLLAATAVAVLALGGGHFYRSFNSKRKHRLLEKKLEVWDGEGGAIPVAQNRTAAQIAPRKTSAASPRADA